MRQVNNRYSRLIVRPLVLDWGWLETLVASAIRIIMNMQIPTATHHYGYGTGSLALIDDLV